MKQLNIAVIGAGMFGYPLANYLSRLHQRRVMLYDNSAEIIEHLRHRGRHPFHYADRQCERLVEPTNDLEETVSKTGYVVFAVPSFVVGKAADAVASYLPKNVKILNVAKGLDEKSGKRLSEVISEHISKYLGTEEYKIAVLSGGMLASEFMDGKFMRATVASENHHFARFVKGIMMSEHLALKTSKDIIGVEYAGAMKNVVALASGIGFGLKYDHSSIAGFITSFSAEMRDLAMKLGAEASTFDGDSPAWWGDIMTTCFGKSRSREFGMLIGEGMTPHAADEDMKSRKRTVEGIHTAKILGELSKDFDYDAPILLGVCDILYHEKPVEDALDELIRKTLLRQKRQKASN